MTAPEAISVASLDWARHWRDLVEHRRITIEALAKQGPQTGFWDGRAQRYANRLQAADPKTDALTRGLVDLVKPNDTVLDVGSGPGRYALPLANIGRQVTAVEPSAAMREQLELVLSKREAPNITVVPTTWEDARIEPHDVVVCANVLYPIAHAVPFIRKLDAHARRAAR